MFDPKQYPPVEMLNMNANYHKYLNSKMLFKKEFPSKKTHRQIIDKDHIKKEDILKKTRNLNFLCPEFEKINLSHTDDTKTNIMRCCSIGKNKSSNIFINNSENNIFYIYSKIEVNRDYYEESISFNRFIKYVKPQNDGNSKKNQKQINKTNESSTSNKINFNNMRKNKGIFNKDNNNQNNNPNENSVYKNFFDDEEYIINKELYPYVEKHYNLPPNIIDLITITADGNCFYRAVSVFFDGEEDFYKNYRKEIYLSAIEKKNDFPNIRINTNTGEMFLYDYIDTIKYNGVYAGDFEISILYKIKNINIAIYEEISNENDIILGYKFYQYINNDNNNNKHLLVLIVKNRNHYQLGYYNVYYKISKIENYDIDNYKENIDSVSKIDQTKDIFIDIKNLTSDINNPFY